MRRTLVIIALLISHLTFAQIQFTAQAKRKVALNERFQLTFTLNAQGDNFRPPNINDFNSLGFLDKGGITWRNGVATFIKSYTYTLSPKKQGTFTIPVASIQYKGKTYRTKPIQITVGKPVKTQQRQQQQRQGYDPFTNPFFQDPFAMFRNKHRPATQQRLQPKPMSDEEKKALLNHVKDEIFVAASVSKANPYLNEGFTVTYRLYVSEPSVNNYAIKKIPEYTGFWKQDIKGNYRVQQTEIEGKPYRYITLKRTLLFPQKTGKLVIEPIDVEMAVSVPTNQYDIFGRRRMKNEVITKKSARKMLQVKALPEEGKPIDFSGAVGQFDFTAQLNKSQVNAGDAVDLTYRLQGTGNLKLLTLPKPKLSSELEVYEPVHQEKLSPTNDGLYGFISEKYTLVPEYGGKFPIQNISFTYFDPKQEKYIHKNVPDKVLNVLGDAKKQNDIDIPDDTASNEVLTLHDIKKSLTQLSNNKVTFFKSRLFWILFLLPFALIPVLMLFKNKRDAYLNDTEGIKTRKASRLVKKYLSTARKNKGNKEAFYEALEKAYHNFLKAKLKLETSDFSQEKIAQILATRSVEESLINRFISSLKTCDMARYSPFTSSDIENEYKNAAEIITQLNKIL